MYSCNEDDIISKPLSYTSSQEKLVVVHIHDGSTSNRHVFVTIVFVLPESRFDALEMRRLVPPSPNLGVFPISSTTLRRFRRDGNVAGCFRRLRGQQVVVVLVLMHFDCDFDVLCNSVERPRGLRGF